MTDPLKAARRLTLGVMGHVDHGKTALVAALTGQDTDRLPEEKRRGVSIALGFAHAVIGDVDIDFIDMPGHERFVRTMVSGATGMQGALLVVAADEGVKPQTREHLDIIALLGLRRVVTAVTKADLADAGPATAAAATLLGRLGLEAAAVVPVSSRTGAGLDDLRAALAEAARAALPVRDDGLPWLPIDRAFTLPGHGLVVTGTLRGGRIGRGEVLALGPAGEAVRVRGLQVHGEAVEAAAPGQRVAVNLRGATTETAGGGHALAPPGALAAARLLTVEVTVPPDAPALRTGAPLTLLIGTAEAPARLRLLGCDHVPPGGRALAQLHLSEPVAAPGRTRLVLRRPSPPATVAGGMVLDPDAARLRRPDAARLDQLAELARVSPEEAARLLVHQAGPAGVDAARLSRQVGLGPALLAEAVKTADIERLRGGDLVTRQALDAVRDRIAATLAGGPKSLAALRREAEAGTQVFDEAVLRLAASGALRVDGAVAVAVLPGQAQDRARAEDALAARMAEALRQGGLSPPELAGEAGSREARRALERLLREHVAVRAYDKVQKREIVFHREAVEAARRLLAPHLAGAGLTVSEAGAILGVSRKFSVPLLEHLDAVQFTRRLGDRRTLGPGATG